MPFRHNIRRSSWMTSTFTRTPKLLAPAVVSSCSINTRTSPSPEAATLWARWKAPPRAPRPSPGCPTAPPPRPHSNRNSSRRKAVPLRPRSPPSWSRDGEGAKSPWRPENPCRLKKRNLWNPHLINTSATTQHTCCLLASCVSDICRSQTSDNRGAPTNALSSSNNIVDLRNENTT